jgi:seryl-tRNA synthetase
MTGGPADPTQVQPPIIDQLDQKHTALRQEVETQLGPASELGEKLKQLGDILEKAKKYKANVEKLDSEVQDYQGKVRALSSTTKTLMTDLESLESSLKKARDYSDKVDQHTKVLLHSEKRHAALKLSLGVLVLGGAMFAGAHYWIFHGFLNSQNFVAYSVVVFVLWFMLLALATYLVVTFGSLE